ncbi:MAG: hypothetical protein H6Q59_3324 [Firmicutes bacterium]|nr:hypothetical protein [Bacillota bacterium]
MNRKTILKSFKSAMWIVLPGILLVLLFCTLMLGKGILEILLPLWLFILFTATGFACARISFIANRLWLRIAISVVLITVAVIIVKLL